MFVSEWNLDLFARGRWITGFGLCRYMNPAYHLKRPKHLALLFIVFVSVSMDVWDRIYLAQENELCFV